MYKNNKILVTICARGGSKGVKNKNIRELDGKPLISYTLDLVKKSSLIDEYVVSTDSEEIIDVVKEQGFIVHFKRPANLAGGKVPRLDVVRHAVHWIENLNSIKYDIIVDLGVATPLKSVDDIELAIKMLVDEKASNIISVTPSSRNPYYNMVEEINGKISIVKTPKTKLTDRRDAPKVYDMNDGVYVWWYNVLFSNNSKFNDRTRLYIMPPQRSVDIDTEFDFTLAKFLSLHKKKNKKGI
jgi:CMP-N,N'-diacetyllegionaminic acid synthase